MRQFEVDSNENQFVLSNACFLKKQAIISGKSLKKIWFLLVSVSVVAHFSTSF